MAIAAMRTRGKFRPALNGHAFDFYRRSALNGFYFAKETNRAKHAAMLFKSRTEVGDTNAIAIGQKRFRHHYIGVFDVKLSAIYFCGSVCQRNFEMAALWIE